MLKGYNDMNTNRPNPFVVDKKIVLSGAGWMDDVTKGYNKTKSVVKSKTGQKNKKALVEDESVMKELTKQSVLEAKSGNNPTVNYEEIQQMTGGNFNKMGTTNMSGLLEKVKNMGKGKYKELMKSNPTVGQIQDKLSKYI